MLEDFYQSIGIPVWLLTITVIWSLLWKGIAMWKSAKLNQPIWFVILLVLNTLGILDILYIFLFSEIKFDSKKANRKLKKAVKRKK